MGDPEGFKIILDVPMMVQSLFDGFWLSVIVCFLGYVVSAGYRMLSRDI